MQTINKIVMLYLISSFVATVLTIPLQKQQTHQQHGMSKIIHKRSTTDESPDELPGHDQENVSSKMNITWCISINDAYL